MVFTVFQSVVENEPIEQEHYRQEKRKFDGVEKHGDSTGLLLQALHIPIEKAGDTLFYLNLMVPAE